MRRLLAVAVMAAISVWLIGCSAGTLTTTSKERDHRIKRIMDTDMKLFIDDFDRALLLDRPSRLTPYQM